MSVRLTSQEGRVALFDSTTGFAFGPTFDSQEDAEQFSAFVSEFTRGEDLRSISQSRLDVYHRRWLESRELKPGDSNIGFGEVIDE